MKTKTVLRFYFRAENVERVYNNLILKNALSLDGLGLCRAERVCEFIKEKDELADLWNYVDGIISGFKECDRAALKLYADLRAGLKSCGGETVKAVKRAVIKFKRRAVRLEGFEKALLLVARYVCLL